MAHRPHRPALVRGRLAGLAFVLLASHPALGQGVLYVDADASPGGNGLSWSTAFRDLQTALGVAQAGDAVWVAEGTYKPTAGAGRTATFTLASGVALYGGFDGTETSLDERDWTAHRSVLSGDVGIPGDSTDNAYHVVTANGVDATAVLDGLTVERGRGGGALAPNDRGAGLLAIGGSPTVRNARFRRNTFGNPFNVGLKVGGGIYVEGGSPVIEDTAFEDNGANGGGGLYASGGAPVLRRVTFRANGGFGALRFEDGSMGIVEDALFEQNTGSAVFIRASSPVFRRSTFRDNVTTDAGTDGAGVYVKPGSPYFEDCLFENLRTRFDLAGAGGAVYVNADLEPSFAVFVRTTFRGNTANTGGGVYVEDSPALFLFCHFERNRALGGGALRVKRHAVAIVGSTFVGNRAEPGISSGHGGAISLSDAPPPGERSLVASTVFAGNHARQGAAVSLSGSGALPIDLVNVTFAGNTAIEDGGALRVWRAGGAQVANAVLWGNEAAVGPEIRVAGGAGPGVGRALIAGGCPVGVTCTGVLDEDPLFVRAPSPGTDGQWGTEDDDYGDLRVQATSPALDYGLAAFLPPDVWDLDSDGDTAEPLPLDVAGQPRVQGAGVDLGAYERAAPALPAVVVQAVPVDPPVVIGPSGGTFAFTVTLTNTTGQPQAVEGWSGVSGPLALSPVVGPVPVTLPPGSSLTRTLSQRVPGNAPPGAYAYAVRVGDFPGAVLSSDAFEVVKEAGAAAFDADGAEGWAVRGWEAPTAEGGEGDVGLSASPNPTRGGAVVTLMLGEAGAVSVGLYDVLGRRVALLHEGALPPGPHALRLDGRGLAPGVYVVRAVVGPQGGAIRTFARRLTLVR